nr:TetR/AcrR family transcriptional regulator [uncultured Hyphomonas sp.]
MANVKATPKRGIVKKAGYHHGNLRNAIIESVARLIAEKSSLDFQLKDVAKLVGTTTPAIYRHFECKQSLLVETALAGYAIQEDYRNKAISLSKPSPLARLIAIGHAYVIFGRTHPGYFRLMKSLETEEMLASPEYQSRRKKALDLTTGLTLECMEAGLFVETDMAVVKTSLQTTALGLAHIYSADQLKYIAPEALEDDEHVARVFELNLGGLLSAKGKRQVREASQNPFDAER